MKKIIKNYRKYKKAVHAAAVEGATVVAVFAPNLDDKYKAITGLVGSLINVAVVVISTNEE